MERGFQLCPKCDGTGLKYQRLAGRIPYGGFIDALNDMPILYRDKDDKIALLKPDNSCPVCKGKMIISAENGKPPE